LKEQSDLTEFETSSEAEQEENKQMTDWKERIFSDVIEINDYPSLEKGVEQTHVGMKQAEENVRKVQDTIQKESVPHKAC